LKSQSKKSKGIYGLQEIATGNSAENLPKWQKSSHPKVLL